MSVYGGDSWSREAQYRKRRVDDLIIEGVDASTYKKLSTGKFACLVCPNNPVLDTPTILSTHINGSRHRIAESRLKDKELAMKEEVNKRIAMSNCVSSNFAPPGFSCTQKKTVSKPLIDRVQKTVSKPLIDRVQKTVSKPLIDRVRKTVSKPLIERVQKATSEMSSGPVEVKSEKVSSVVPCIADCRSNGGTFEIESLNKGVVAVIHSLDYRERQEKELKFTASGWKRDCHGKWFKDENVEFDSDEEDPNIVLYGAN